LCINFFELEKNQGENKMWNRIKNTEGKYKYDIDSIIDEQIKFYSKLFTTEGWDENSVVSSSVYLPVPHFYVIE
jgi:hypothetical protein